MPCMIVVFKEILQTQDKIFDSTQGKYADWCVDVSLDFIAASISQWTKDVVEVHAYHSTDWFLEVPAPLNWHIL